MPRQRFHIFFFLVCILFSTFLVTGRLQLITRVFAVSEVCTLSPVPRDKLEGCIQEIQNEVDALKPAQEKNQQELSNLKKQLASIQTQVKNLSLQVTRLGTDIEDREEKLGVQTSLLEERVADYYIRSRTFSPLVIFLSSADASDFTRELALREEAAGEDRRIIGDLSNEVIKLNEDKLSLEKSKASLQKVQAQVDSRAQFLSKEVAKTESYISTLSAKQQSLLAQKAGGFQTSIGDTPLSLEPCGGAPGASNYCNPGFTGFAAFSFGAPHRAGMSQYGAYGRAKSGQNAEQILSAYYQGAELKKDYASPDTIGVDGQGRVSLEDNYMLGIYEVPESWGDQGGFEALKAQAVAARSYALSVTNNGSGSICTTEACQVYKPQLKSGKWAQAVRETRGWVMVRGGSPAKTVYSSTTGGYTISLYGWSGIKDTSGDWPDSAYEKVSGSPWFYKAWFKTRSGDSCGKSNPWLKPEELADIINAWVVLYQGGGDTGRIVPQSSCFSGNPYSISDLQNIGGYHTVSSVSVTYSNNGSTVQVDFSTDKGSKSIPGDQFMRAFNLRAPGYLGIKSSLFNIVKTN